MSSGTSIERPADSAGSGSADFQPWQLFTLAALIGARHVVLETEEFANPLYVANGSDRCYHCKTDLYERVGDLAKRLGVDVIVNGANADDLGDYRPGLDAAREAGARHPYVEAGIDKATIRAIARAIGLGDLAEIPASPCLSSRVETGIRIEPTTLRRIEAAEIAVRPFVPANTAIRCRVRAGGIVVEIEEEVLETLDDARRQVIKSQVAKSFGREPTLAPYRMGSAFLR